MQQLAQLALTERHQGQGARLLQGCGGGSGEGEGAQGRRTTGEGDRGAAAASTALRAALA